MIDSFWKKKWSGTNLKHVILMVLFLNSLVLYIKKNLSFCLYKTVCEEEAQNS
jgi:hypothetical protein